jgi:hypothetical protein
MAETTSLPRRLDVTARIDDNPRYKGSVHDNEVARRLGYRAALIPGAFVYGYVTRLAVQRWGMDWIARGQISTRFRRPVYDGDQLVVSCSEPERAADGLSADAVVTNQDGEEVLVGGIGLPDRRPEVPASLPTFPLPDPKPKIAVGELRVGTPVGTRGAVLTEADVETSRAAFGETEPIYAREGLVHSGCLVRLTMGDTLQSFSFPIPVIFVSAEVQNFAPVHPGRRMSTSGVVTAVYERKGKHYFDSEEYLIADGLGVVARNRRVNLYAMQDKDPQ